GRSNSIPSSRGSLWMATPSSGVSHPSAPGAEKTPNGCQLLLRGATTSSAFLPRSTCMHERAAERRVAAEPAGLVRGLGSWDTALITAGTMLGSSIFIAAAFVPRALPHAALVLVAWLFGGLLTLAGALSYAELGAMFPRAG